MSRNMINFAPYEPPPDAPNASTSRTSGGSSAKYSRPKTPWFSATSYQSGARAADLQGSNAHSSSSASSSSSFAPHAAAGRAAGYPNVAGDVLWDAENGSVGGGAGVGSASGSGVAYDQYETVFGWRVDIEAAAAYLLGPFLAICLLVLETKNDYV